VARDEVVGSEENRIFVSIIMEEILYHHRGAFT